MNHGIGSLAAEFRYTAGTAIMAQNQAIKREWRRRSWRSKPYRPQPSQWAQSGNWVWS